MKLLIDENLSPGLVRELAAEFPGSLHVHRAGFTAKADETIWEFAKSNGFCILSKDSDFQHRSFMLGHPPKVIGVALGNCSTARVAALLRREIHLVRLFHADAESSFLMLGESGM